MLYTVILPFMSDMLLSIGTVQRSIFRSLVYFCSVDSSITILLYITTLSSTLACHDDNIFPWENLLNACKTTNELVIASKPNI